MLDTIRPAFKCTVIFYFKSERYVKRKERWENSVMELRNNQAAEMKKSRHTAQKLYESPGVFALQMEAHKPGGNIFIGRLERGLFFNDVMFKLKQLG